MLFSYVGLESGVFSVNKAKCNPAAVAEFSVSLICRFWRRDYNHNRQMFPSEYVSSIPHQGGERAFSVPLNTTNRDSFNVPWLAP